MSLARICSDVSYFNMKLKYFLIPMLALVTSGALQAQTSDSSPSPGHEHTNAWIWKKLNLTDTQKQQIKSIRQGSKTQLRSALAAVLTARMKLQQDIAANNQADIPANGIEGISYEAVAAGRVDWALSSQERIHFPIVSQSI